MKAAEELTGANHVGADCLVCRLLQGVEGGNSLKEGILAPRVVSLKDAAPHPEFVLFVRGVVEED